MNLLIIIPIFAFFFVFYLGGIVKFYEPFECWNNYSPKDYFSLVSYIVFAILWTSFYIGCMYYFIRWIF